MHTMYMSRSGQWIHPGKILQKCMLLKNFTLCNCFPTLCTAHHDLYKLGRQVGVRGREREGGKRGRDKGSVNQLWTLVSFCVTQHAHNRARQTWRPWHRWCVPPLLNSTQCSDAATSPSSSPSPLHCHNPNLHTLLLPISLGIPNKHTYPTPLVRSSPCTFTATHVALNPGFPVQLLSHKNPIFLQSCKAKSRTESLVQG